MKPAGRQILTAILGISFGALAAAGCQNTSPPQSATVAGASAVQEREFAPALYRISDAVSRSISPENLSGEKGQGGRTELEDGSAKYAARNLGLGWKVNPYIVIQPGDSFTLGEAAGPGVINHIWMTLGGRVDYRSAVLRMYWDDETTPSVEAPVGDFFASGWGRGNEPVIDSSMLAVNPGSGFNSFWQMPFRKKFRIEMENRSEAPLTIYYQIDYSLQQVPDDAAYFHAQFRLANKLPEMEVFTILDGVEGEGHYVGTWLGHGAFSPGWWGEGEIKFYLDGDTDFPTINGTGEEDYFLGSYGYAKAQEDGERRETSYSSLYAGFYTVGSAPTREEVFDPEGKRRYGQYRWHVYDPIRFKSDLRVTMQSLGWTGASTERPIGDISYLPLQDYLASVAFWYQREPHAPFPALPNEAALKIPDELLGQE